MKSIVTVSTYMYNSKSIEFIIALTILIISVATDYFLDVKFKDFSMTFQDLFKEIQDLFYQLKPDALHIFFKTNFIIWLYWTGWQWKPTNGRSLATKIMPCEVTVFVLQHCRIKNILTNSRFLLFLERKKETFCLFQDFQGPDPNSRTFQGLEIFSPNSRTSQDFQGPWQPCII